MGDMEDTLGQARQFLATVLPWPEAEGTGEFLSLVWSYKSDKYDKPGWGGRACRSHGEMMNALTYALRTESTLDIYVCLSSQRAAQERAGKNGRPFYTPMRTRSNAGHIKSFFLDIDVKDGPNGYASIEEAIEALGQFTKTTGLPRPSVIVSSGGGLHVYWVLAERIPIHEWQPLADALGNATKKHGLRCDTQVSVDAVRILRVPETQNRKGAAPRPVAILGGILDAGYNLERLASVLGAYRLSGVPTHATDSVEALPVRAPLVGASPLAAGVEAYPKVDLDHAAAECAFLADALATGGATFPNPLWNLTTLISTFTVGGEADAHRMASGHPGYSYDSTHELYERKVRERDERGLGWPRCATISSHGCTVCQACPKLGNGKSPLHHAPRAIAPVTPAVEVAPVIVADQADLPAGYHRDAHGIVYRELLREDGSVFDDPVHHEMMTNPKLQRNPWVLRFTTAAEYGKTQQVEVPCGIIGGMEMRRTLGEQGMVLKPTANAAAKMAEFLMSWVRKLKATKDAVVTTVPFGWNVDRGKITGFCYGGTIWTPDGPQPAPASDSVMTRQHTPIGDKSAWIDAAKLTTGLGSPAHEALLALSFGAPLVRFTGHPGALMSTYSTESGIGKSTALDTGAAVWGDPVMAKQGVSDTNNSVMTRMAELRSLPMYWDEIKTEEQAKAFVTVAFKVTTGRDKNRLNAHSHIQDAGKWQTLLCVASNESILDIIVNQTKATTAGIYRTFEFVTPSPTKGVISSVDAQRIMARLNDNYGMVGAEYAQFLGENYDKIDKEVIAFAKKMEKDLDVQRDERVWLCLLVCTCMGAKYANRLGFTEFNEEALDKFMVASFQTMRATLKEQPSDMRDALNVSNVLAQFLKYALRTHTLWTNRIHVSKGKPAKGAISVVRETNNLNGAWVHIGRDDKLVRISSYALGGWLQENNYPRHTLIEALEREFGLKKVVGRIGGGTDFATPTEYLFEISIQGRKELNFIDEE